MLNLLFVQAAACAAPRTIGRKLPAIVSKRLVGLGHTVHFFLTLDSRAGVVARVDDLGAEALGHGLLAALAGELDQPAQRQGLTALRADLDRDLIGRAANAAGLNLQARRR